VTLLRDAGAIPFVKTNVPQALLVAETDNAIFGRALNPFNPERQAM
jgi:amidase